MQWPHSSADCKDGDCGGKAMALGTKGDGCRFSICGAVSAASGSLVPLATPLAAAELKHVKPVASGDWRRLSTGGVGSAASGTSVPLVALLKPVGPGLVLPQAVEPVCAPNVAVSKLPRRRADWAEFAAHQPTGVRCLFGLSVSRAFGLSHIVRLEEISCGVCGDDSELRPGVRPAHGKAELQHPDSSTSGVSRALRK